MLLLGYSCSLLFLAPGTLLLSGCLKFLKNAGRDQLSKLFYLAHFMFSFTIKGGNCGEKFLKLNCKTARILSSVSDG